MAFMHHLIHKLRMSKDDTFRLEHLGHNRDIN